MDFLKERSDEVYQMKTTTATILMCLFLGCANDSLRPIETLPPVQFETVLQSSHAFTSDDFVTVALRSKEDEQAFLQTHPTRVPFPEINYDRNMAIGIIVGMRGSTSILLTIDSVKPVAGILKVYAHEYHPLGQRMAIGYPAHFIALQRFDLPVHFEPVKIVREVSQPGIYGPWVFNYYENIESGERELPPQEMGDVTIEFGMSGEVSGVGPCNAYGGGFRLQEGNLMAIISLRSTLRACALDILNRWEARYFEVLQRVSSYELDQDTLKLIPSQNRQAIVFRRS